MYNRQADHRRVRMILMLVMGAVLAALLSACNDTTAPCIERRLVAGDTTDPSSIRVWVSNPCGQELVKVDTVVMR